MTKTQDLKRGDAVRDRQARHRVGAILATTGREILVKWEDMRKPQWTIAERVEATDLADTWDAANEDKED